MDTKAMFDRQDLLLQGPLTGHTFHDAVGCLRTGLETSPLPESQQVLLLAFGPVHDVLSQRGQEFATMPATPCRHHQTLDSRDKVNDKMIIERVRVPAQPAFHGACDQLRNELLDEGLDSLGHRLWQGPSRLPGPAGEGHTADRPIGLCLRIRVLGSSVTYLHSAWRITSKAVQASRLSIPYLVPAKRVRSASPKKARV